VFLIAWIVRKLVVIALVIAIPAVAGEFIARKLVGDTVRNVVTARFGGSAKVGFGSTPLLWQLAHGQLDDVTVTEADASIGGLPPLSLTANFEDVRVTDLIGLRGAVQTIEAEASLGPAGVRDLLATGACAGGLPDGIGAALTAGPRVVIRRGHVFLLPPHGRSVELRLVPVAANGALLFDLVGVAEDGAGVSAATVSALGSHADCTRTIGGLPFNLRLTGARATDGILKLAFRGSGAQLQE
jgi:hypothetical protein